MIEAVKHAVQELEAIHIGDMTPMAHEVLKEVIFTLCTAIMQEENNHGQEAQ